MDDPYFETKNNLMNRSSSSQKKSALKILQNSNENTAYEICKFV